MLKINILKNNTYKLVIGLGNIGSKYARTRHNAGFLFIDFLEKKYELSSQDFIQKQDSVILMRKYPQYKLATLKPQTMMNASGEAVKQVLKYLELEKDNIILAHDDLDLQLGSFKVQLDKSPKVHNGVTSVEKQLGFKNFYRIRIGIENRADKRISGSDFVLGKFNKEELSVLDKTFEEICKTIFD